MSDFEKYALTIEQRLKTIPCYWDGKSAIQEMKDNNFNQWKQMEWIGFYFEYLCSKNLRGIMKIPSGKKYGKVEFDGFYNFPWDFKAHAEESGNKIIVNDSEATNNAIKEFGQVGIILASGRASYDADKRDFQKWHEEIKGGESEYERERKKRGAPSRTRKISFKINKIILANITEQTLEKTTSFQDKFRNSSGPPRRRKTLLDLRELKNEQTHIMEF